MGAHEKSRDASDAFMSASAKIFHPLLYPLILSIFMELVSESDQFSSVYDKKRSI